MAGAIRTVLSLSSLLLLHATLPSLAAAQQLGRITGEDLPIAPSPEVDLIGPLARPPSLSAVLDPAVHYRRILYPMGLADVEAGFARFGTPAGRPEQLTIVDLVPFGALSQVLERHRDAAIKASAYRYIGQDGVWEGGYIDIREFGQRVGLAGPMLLWELERLGATDLEVTSLDPRGRPAPPPKPLEMPPAEAGATRWFEWIEDRSERQATQIRFRWRGQPRLVRYIEGNANRLESLPAIVSEVLGGGLDAYLEKAPYGVPQQAAYRTGLLARGVLALDARRGVLVGEAYAERPPETVDVSRWFETSRRLDKLLAYGATHIHRRPRHQQVRADLRRLGQRPARR